ncbi:hypothetical protein CEXT_777611 [Caerostris extrusa]|uniref:Uncharacterized protein n=1 Tax=Caerostris extrusa TaxID=172846 RepID=A0AAV4XGV8_CAEEX|nr:hypothetical protein CEXT_777611 [Caerostris extrusa]
MKLITFLAISKYEYYVIKPRNERLLKVVIKSLRIKTSLEELKTGLKEKTSRCQKCGEDRRTGEWPIKEKLQESTCINCNDKCREAPWRGCRTFSKPVPKNGKCIEKSAQIPAKLAFLPVKILHILAPIALLNEIDSIFAAFPKFFEALPEKQRTDNNLYIPAGPFGSFFL